MFIPSAFGFKQKLFIHRNRKFNKQVQETQTHYAYLSVTNRQNGNYIQTFAENPFLYPGMIVKAIVYVRRRWCVC